MSCLLRKTWRLNLIECISFKYVYPRASIFHYNFSTSRDHRNEAFVDILGVIIIIESFAYVGYIVKWESLFIMFLDPAHIRFYY